MGDLQKPHFKALLAENEPDQFEDILNFSLNRLPLIAQSVATGRQMVLNYGADRVEAKAVGAKFEVPDFLKNAFTPGTSVEGVFTGSSFILTDLLERGGEDFRALDLVDRVSELEDMVEDSGSDRIYMAPYRMIDSLDDLDDSISFLRQFSGRGVSILRAGSSPHVSDDPNAMRVVQSMPLDLLASSEGDGVYKLTTMDGKVVALVESDREFTDGAPVTALVGDFDQRKMRFKEGLILRRAESAMGSEQVFEKLDLGPVEMMKIYDVGIKKQSEEKQMVFGVVLAPNVADLQGDVMSEDEVEKTAHDFLRRSRVIGLGHREKADADLIESYIARKDFEMNGDLVTTGSWVMGVHVKDPDTWQKIKSGEINSFSIGGFGLREEISE